MQQIILHDVRGHCSHPYLYDQSQDLQNNCNKEGLMEKHPCGCTKCVSFISNAILPPEIQEGFKVIINASHRGIFMNYVQYVQLVGANKLL